MMDKDNEDRLVDAIVRISRAVSTNDGGIKCEDLQYISGQLGGLRDAVCRPAVPCSIHSLEHNNNGHVGDLTEAVCAVATALFSISRAIEGLSNDT